ncbi:ABC transporter permease [Roseospira marina]|uniref:ABC transporter permease n=1 Tax=Roseospira marina TaxID=140057 RepID=A0A5M6I9S4_9PROT|nr:ABC transporter permease [Roseospira marina]KAA5604991.1 ABC transporter permease [Roseospira marina]MBB4315004.1 peptide/nickel transport system permease protein [Roseospira marina]MBB5088004.1 peptide/nickel transport system permease protein [Roseospira marina]
MAWILAQRAVALALTLLAASILVFVVLEVLPGDPALLILGVNAREDTLAALRATMGLDQPAVWRYLTWIGGLLQGHFQNSLTYGVPVDELLAPRLAVSLPLAALSLSLAVALALPLGVLAAARRGRATDTAILALGQLGVAVPNFWLGILLVLLFAVTLHWLPAGGFPGWEAGVGPGLAALILPAVALALPQAAILTRVTRSAVLEVLGEDYMRTARAKGLSRAAALWHHGLRNAMIPVVTILGLQFSFLLAGTIIIENVFNLPGVGRLIFQAISQRDLVVVRDLVVLLAGTVGVVNALVDLSYAALDPRLRHGADGARPDD